MNQPLAHVVTVASDFLGCQTHLPMVCAPAKVPLYRWESHRPTWGCPGGGRAYMYSHQPTEVLWVRGWVLGSLAGLPSCCAGLISYFLFNCRSVLYIYKSFVKLVFCNYTLLYFNIVVSLTILNFSWHCKACTTITRYFPHFFQNVSKVDFCI